ncbi:MAG TPA: NAD-dependent epimerase/dehydratase family protein [Planctomycetota bacterium]|jgi:dihydroflavonol-4-reductase|nr:NAD-dependent epimerase/dehydratase family protein [Planctomycetota bacterium]HPY75608.1 NAD-dependent epimerase/dehydratase family protein [Planctomycetota bacterium]HQB01377.1 NAD-dependent epimerase/dehydratase family protein [Planctomycetota bacterium]
MKALVTGATGFIGYWVARKLIEAGWDVKIMVRNHVPEHTKQLSAEMCQGDLLDIDSLKNAVSGCTHVFHLAAHYRLWERDPQIYYDINVKGTENLLHVAMDQNVEKIIYTSSVSTLKLDPSRKPVNEENIATADDMIGHYKRSKIYAEQSVLKMVEQGSPIIIVSPSTPVGPFDVKPTPTGKIIVNFLKGKMPAYVDTGLNLVAVEDVAIGHILAAEKGQVGRSYILGHENLTLKQIFDILAKISGRKAPNIRMPLWVAFAAAYCSETTAKLLHKEPSIPLDGVKMSTKYMFFDSTRAKTELGFQPTDIEAALQRAVSWFQENNMV